MTEYLNKWRKDNPDKYHQHKIKQRERERANNVVMNCWRNDYRKKGEECTHCGGTEKLEYHHTDYPSHSGYTLCMTCHRNLHRGDVLFGYHAEEY